MDGAGNVSVQDSIIITSLNAISGKDANDIVQLFMSSHVYAEDQVRIVLLS